MEVISENLNNNLVKSLDDNDTLNIIIFNYFPYVICITLFIISYFYLKNKQDQDIDYNSGLIKYLDFNEIEIGKDLKFRYMIVYLFAKATDWCFCPFIYEFYFKFHHLQLDLIAKLVAISFLSSYLLGPLIIKIINDRKNRKFSCLVYGVFIIISCFLRLYKRNFGLMVLSQIFYGISSFLLNTCFEEWVYTELLLCFQNKITQRHFLIEVYERSILQDSVIGVVVSIIVNYLNITYGVHAPYYFSVFLAVISMLLTYNYVLNIDDRDLLKIERDRLQQLKENKYNLSDLFSNKQEIIIKNDKDNPFTIIFNISESIYISIFSIFTFCWTPKLKEFALDLDVSQLFIYFTLGNMLGSIIFQYYYSFRYSKDALKTVKLASILNIISLIIMIFSHNIYFTILGFILFQISFGIYLPSMNIIKVTYLPYKNSNSELIMYKLPFYIILLFLFLSSGVIISINILLIVSSLFSILLLILQFSFYDKGDADLYDDLYRSKRKVKKE